MLQGLSSNFCNDLGIYISLATVVFVVFVSGAKVEPLVAIEIIENVLHEVIVLIVADEAILIVVGDKPRTEIEIIVTGAVKFVDVLDRGNNVIYNQSFLTLGQGNQRHLKSLFSVDTSIIEPFQQ